jgi:DNA-binding ferritin-like protein
MEKSLKEIKKEIDEFGEYLIKLEKKHIASMNKAMHEAEDESIKKVEKTVKDMMEEFKKDVALYNEKLKYLGDQLTEREQQIKEMKVDKYVIEHFWKLLYKILFKRKYV